MIPSVSKIMQFIRIQQNVIMKFQISISYRFMLPFGNYIYGKIRKFAKITAHGLCVRSCVCLCVCACACVCLLVSLKKRNSDSEPKEQKNNEQFSLTPFVSIFIFGGTGCAFTLLQNHPRIYHPLAAWNLVAGQEYQQTRTRKGYRRNIKEHKETNT